MSNKGYFLPVSILIAAVLISASLIFTVGRNSAPADTSAEQETSADQKPGELIAPVTKNDFFRGAENATVTIVEYSDFECPFCKDFHVTMKQIIEEYDGQVAWVYRQFPLEQLHSKAIQEAQASECVGELGGGSAFWDFADRVYNITPSNDGLDLNELPQIAEEIGIDRSSFEECLESGRTASEIEKDMKDVEKLMNWNLERTGRGIGTPFSVVISDDGQSFTIPGALPYEQISIAIDQLLNSNN